MTPWKLASGPNGLVRPLCYRSRTTVSELRSRTKRLSSCHSSDWEIATCRVVVSVLQSAKGSLRGGGAGSGCAPSSGQDQPLCLLSQPLIPECRKVPPPDWQSLDLAPS